MEFPKKYPCPHCGNESRLGLEAFAATHYGQTPELFYLIRMDIPLPRMPTDLVDRKILVFMDFCWNCGTQYVARIELAQGNIEIRNQKGKPGIPIPPGAMPNIGN